jgi:hypothetical protein
MIIDDYRFLSHEECQQPTDNSRCSKCNHIMEWAETVGVSERYPFGKAGVRVRHNVDGPYCRSHHHEAKVYFDGVHLISPFLQNLHAFAHSVGLKREWFQDKPGRPHYDVLKGMVQKVEAVGVIRLRPALLVRKAIDERWEGWER